MHYTILGSTGFIGSNLVYYIRNQSIECLTPSRNHIFTKNENLGHIIYCIGLTADFRQKPMETVKAHICKLMEVLENSSYESFLFLSSARVYSGGNTGNENDSVNVNSSNFSDLYNISKLMGESICLSIPNKKIRIARLSNVIGKDFNSSNFLFSLIKEAVDDNMISLSTSLSAVKDYIRIEDVIKIITLISEKGEERMYNIASGIQISNEQIVVKIKEYTNCQIETLKSTNDLNFPQISIDKIKNEFTFNPSNILDSIESLILDYKHKKYDTN